MFFNLPAFVFSPFVLIFASIFFGRLFAKIKFKGFSFGAASALFFGLFFGYLTLKYAHHFPKTSSDYISAQTFINNGVINNDLFNLFLILFVTAIGLLASNSVSKVIKKYGAKFIILGFLMTFMGAATSFVFTEFQPTKDMFIISGTYSGAMTSSPSLASALETNKKLTSEEAKDYPELDNVRKQKILDVLNGHSKGSHLSIANTVKLTQKQQSSYINIATSETGVSHSISFPFGDIVVILAMSFLHKIFRINLEKEKAEFAQIMSEGDAKKSKNQRDANVKTVLFDVTGFALAALFGLFIGNIAIPIGSLGALSLGATGGALIGGLTLGYFGKISFINFRMNEQVLQVLRTLTLEAFLSIVGLRYGYGVVDAIINSGLTLVIIALVTVSVALLSGFLVGRYLMKMNWIILAGAICGGMTNTTGMGTLLNVLDSDDAAISYGATYVFGLIGMVLFTILLHEFIVLV